MIYEHQGTRLNLVKRHSGTSTLSKVKQNNLVVTKYTHPKFKH